MANEYLKAIEPTRLRILSLIRQNNIMTPGELIPYFDMTPPALTQHLDVLKKIGIIRVEKDGNYRRYSINQKKIRDIDSFMQSYVSGNFTQLKNKHGRKELENNT